MLYEIDPLADSRWTEFVQGHQHSSIFHSRGWLEALRRTYGYTPIVFTTNSGGEKLTNAVVFCHVKSWLTGSRLVSLPFSDHCQPLLGKSDEACYLLSKLTAASLERHCGYCELRPLTTDGMDDLYADKQLSKSASYYFHSLNLRPSAEGIFERFHKSCVQRKIRKAESSHLQYVEGRSEALLKDFYELLVITRLRLGSLPQPFQWFRNLATSLAEDLTIRVVYKDSQPVASIITIRHGKALVYKYGCSNAKLHYLGGVPYLFWRAILDAKTGGIEVLDLGRTDEDNQGLAKFKEHLGSTCSQLTYYRYTLHKTQIPKWGTTVFGPMMRYLPNSFCRAAGKVLYTHLG